MKRNQSEENDYQKLMGESDISRREFINRSLKGVAGLSAGLYVTRLFGCSSEVSPDGIRPNILLLVADDAGWRDVGYHGSEINTPNLDHLMEEGVELNHFYVWPTCSPTRASLLTGRPASRFGILGPIGGKSKLHLPQETPTLAELLRENGYTTAITGKWHLGLQPEVGPDKYGFEYAYGYLHGQIDQYTHVYKYGDRTWHRNGEFIDEEGHATDLITKEAVNYLTQIRDKSKPFFLYVPFSVPHFPLQEEAKWVKPYEKSIENESRRVFAASVAHMDNAVGKIISTLENENLRENTLVIFISDNGAQENWFPGNDEYEGRHGPNDVLGDNRPLRDWKKSVYEGGIRVPGFINWPSRLKSRQVDDVTCAVDVLPTVAALAGVHLPSDMQVDGENIWPAVSGGKPLTERVLYWRTKSQMAVRKGEWKLIHNGKTPDKGEDELYNLRTDPYEKENISVRYPEIVNELKQEMKNQATNDLLVEDTGGLNEN
jgi:arylsulfatase B